jgi:cell division protein FtsN
MTPAQLAETSIAELPEIKPALKSEIGSRATLAPQHSGKASQAETLHDQSHLPPAKRFVVRIGSFRTRSRLDAARAQFLELHHDAIDSDLVSTERVDLGAGRGIWNRLIIGPFPERDSAQTWCQRLRDSVFSPDCFVAVRR